MTEVCPICESGNLSPSLVTETITYNGQQLTVPPIEISVCSHCGEELVLPAQARRNDLRFADAKRVADGLMTSVAIRDWRRQLGLTQAQAARILGGGVNGFSRYERGEIIQTRSMDWLMRVTADVPQARSYVFGSTAASAGWQRSEGTVTNDVDRLYVSTRYELKAANEELSEWSTVRPEAQRLHAC